MTRQTNRKENESFVEPRTKYNLLSNKNLIIHNITKSDDNRLYACIVNNRIDNDTRQSRFKSLRVRGEFFTKLNSAKTNQKSN